MQANHAFRTGIPGCLGRLAPYAARVCRGSSPTVDATDSTPAHMRYHAMRGNDRLLSAYTEIMFACSDCLNIF